MDVDALGLEPGEAIGDDLESLPHRVEMIQPFLQTDVAQVVGAQLVAQEPGKVFILLEEGDLPVGAENVMAVLDVIDQRGSLPFSCLFNRPKISLMRWAVRRQRPISQKRSKILWVGKRRLRMKLRQYWI